ncbi:branched-chain amino acid ABC transporter permease, partial [Microbacteriaceae bacterium K1510]|nr:branched-chain amino acid ABC transporter permease [Microbacteriaceae bacterium K1510]
SNLFRSRTGRAFVAVRDRDLAAEVMGINLFRYKVLAFAISSFFIGIAGALMGHYTLVISPEHFDIGVSIEYLAMILIGGLGSVVGSIFGAVFFTLLP